MGAYCCCCGDTKPKGKTVSQRPLDVNTVKRTTTGKVINLNVSRNFLTEDQQNILKKRTFEMCVILSDPFKSFDKITDYLYLTGFGGISDENIRINGIKHVINMTYELPYYHVSRVDCIKIAVDDHDDEDLYIYFDRLSDKINECIVKEEPTVVHCLCGISRSATIVLGLPLKDAFQYVYQRRQIVRPNNGFFKQLTRFEAKLRETTKTTKSPTKLVIVTTPSEIKVEMPEFLVRQYPQLATPTSKTKDSTIDMSTASSYLSVYSKTKQ